MTTINSMPQRIQRKRTKGWKMPPNAVYVGRPTKWGNPWKVGQQIGSAQIVRVYATASDCVALYRAYVTDIDSTEPQQDLTELRGKNLACWCPLDQPCHADVLLELANAPSALTRA